MISDDEFYARIRDAKLVVIFKSIDRNQSNISHSDTSTEIDNIEPEQQFSAFA